MRFFIFHLILVFILGLLQYYLWFGPNNLLYESSLKVQLNAAKIKLNTQKSINDSLLADIQSLRTDKDLFEELAREKLLMIKENETLYFFE